MNCYVDMSRNQRQTKLVCQSLSLFKHADEFDGSAFGTRLWLSVSVHGSDDG
jgi:hypothetical protein